LLIIIIIMFYVLFFIIIIVILFYYYFTIYQSKLEGHSVEHMYLRQRCFDGSLMLHVLSADLVNGDNKFTRNRTNLRKPRDRATEVVSITLYRPLSYCIIIVTPAILVVTCLVVVQVWLAD